jgi:linear primary-alkylsulfatase
MNAGLNGTEIAEVLRLPDVLARQWFNRGYYGTMSHNAKAVYQRYMGWYDANPANLHALPPEPAAKRYVEAMGGADAVLARARQAADSGDYRWAAMLLDHVVFADDTNQAARDALADVYVQLGYQAEAGTWRNMYLTGAQELRHGVAKLPPVSAGPDFIRATPTTMLLDFAAVRLNPDRANGKHIVLNIVLSDVHEKHLITIENDVLIHEQDITDDHADATVTMARADLLQTLLAGVPVGLKTTTGAIKVEGKSDAYADFVALIDPVDANFPIVTPD